VFYKATVIVRREMSLPLKLTCTSNTLLPPTVLAACHPPDTLVNKYHRVVRKKVCDERFVSQIGEFPVAMHI
jgi:hypothetical protein